MIDKNKAVEIAYKTLNENKIYPEIWYDSNIPVIYVQIDNGDWKHEHIRAKLLLEELGFTYAGKNELGNSEDDTYSAIHSFIFSSVEIPDTLEYEIYQIQDMHECPYGFMRWEFAQKHNFSLSDYKSIYSGKIKNMEIPSALESLFELFNLNHPSDFHGHSLSVSDIVKLDNKYYYCNSFGFEDITEIVEA